MEKKLQAMKLIFEEAKQLKQGGSATRWDAAKISVTTTGRCLSNTQGKQLVTDFVKRLGGDPNSYQLTYKANEEAGLMALYLTKPGDKGVMKVSQYDNSIAFHAGACLEDFPKLRPAAKVDCQVEEIVDGNGNPCLVVHVVAGTPSRTIKRKNKGKKQQKPDPNPNDATDSEDTQS